MKKIFSIACLLSVAAATNAQVTFTPEIGYSLNKFFGFNYNPIVNEQYTKNFDWIGSPRAGISFDIPIGENGFSIEPGLYYSIRSSKTVVDDEAFKTTTIQRLNYAELPVHLKYSWSVANYTGKLFLHVAPYVGYGISGKGTLTNITKKPNYLVEETNSDIKFGKEMVQPKPLDYGMYVGTGYQFQWGLQVRAMYGISFANMSNYANEVINPGSVFNISVGYVLGRKLPGRFY
jgi:hypothetical protein